jgi:N-acetyl-anhydromuramyl-L-alanine amidase AmpD
MTELDLNTIVQIEFSKDQYYQEETEKNVVVLHHTVSGKGSINVARFWETTPEEIATAMIVDWDGKIHQLFSTRFWAHHIGIKAEFLKNKGYKDYLTRNKLLNKQSIGVELNSWGGLIQGSNNNWYPVKWDEDANKYIPNLKVKPIQNVQIYENGYRGFFGFEKYSDEQIESVRQLLIYWNKRYNIPLGYNKDMWDISKNALDGNPGIWAHVSYRPDKSDCHPQAELVQMLKSLNNA